MSTVTFSDLIPDPTHLRVYYLLFRGEGEARKKKVRTGTDTVIEHIGRVTLDKAKTIESPTRMRNGKKGKESPNIGKDTISYMTREEYFHHLYVMFTLDGFLNLLKTPLPGFDDDGRVLDGSGEEELRLLGVDQVCNLDSNTADVFVSFPTVERKKI